MYTNPAPMNTATYNTTQQTFGRSISMFQERISSHGQLFVKLVHLVLLALMVLLPLLALSLQLVLVQQLVQRPQFVQLVHVLGNTLHHILLFIQNIKSVSIHIYMYTSVVVE